MSTKKRVKIRSKQNRNLPKLLIVAGIVILAAAIFVLKNQPSTSATPAVETCEEQFDRYVKEGKPVFAFFHSTNCQPCMEMMRVVDQVYPEFKDEIALVDVNVYDPQNRNLLRRAGINTIPTQVFINRKGEGQVIIGVIEASKLRQQLVLLKETP